MLSYIILLVKGKREVRSYTASVPSCEGEKAGKERGNILESSAKTADY
jgi:hypothetical protein